MFLFRDNSKNKKDKYFIERQQKHNLLDYKSIKEDNNDNSNENMINKGIEIWAINYLSLQHATYLTVLKETKYL